MLAIDLGTSNTVAVLSAHGRAPRVVEVDGAANMSSAVFAADDGRLVVGREAERQARLNPARFEPNPKRRVDEGTLLLGDRVVPVTEAFAAVLAKVAGEVSRQLGGALPGEVRLTHPAQWGPVRRNVLLSAARQAGLGTNLVLIPEPVAAAAHFASFPGRALAPGQALVVYDLGAGTFDVAAVGATQNGFVVLAEAGLPDLGGLDVDQALLTHIGRQVSSRDPAGWQRLVVPRSTADRRALRALREDIRAAKEALSGHPQTEVPLPEQFGDVLITRAELEDLIRQNLLRSTQLLADTVRTAGLTPDRLAGVYLVGGSSRIPLVAALIAEQLRIVPTNLDQPETAVALGALHVPGEGASLRTESLPEERTTHIAPPPRPAPVPRAPVTGPSPAAVSHPGPPPRPAWIEPPAEVAPRAGRRWLWIALLIGGLLAVVGIALNSGWRPWESPDPGPVVASPVQLPNSVSNCEDVIPVAEVSDAVGNSAEVDTEDYTSGSGTGDLCSWSPDGFEGETFSVSVKSAEWSPYSGGEDYVLDGNSANADTEFDVCIASVAVGDGRAIEVWVSYRDCDVAKGLLEIAFANLAKA